MTVPLKPWERNGWTPPRLALDPLALLLRSRYPSRAALARACGLSYQMLRTYTDGLWTCKKPPAAFVLAMLGTAIDPDELDAAVTAATLSLPGPPLTFASRSCSRPSAGSTTQTSSRRHPHIHELLRDRRLPLKH